MKLGDSFLKIFNRIAFFLAYSLGYGYLAVEGAGGGHGTLIFLVPIITWMLFLIALILLTWVENPAVQTLIFVCMVIHYIATIAISFMLEYDYNFVYFLKVWNGSYLYVLITIGWYLVGQFMFWWLFWKSKNKLG